MFKIKNFILAGIALSSLLTGFVLTSPSTAKAAICYVETGAFRVAPNTAMCPPPGGGVDYYDMSSPRVRLASVPVGNSRCFALRLQPSGAGRRYEEERCVDLEYLRSLRNREDCDAAGGTLRTDADPLGGGISTYVCICPDDGGTSGGSCVRDDGSTYNPEPVYAKSDCNEDSNGDGSKIDKEDCGITAYVVLATNILAGLVAVVVAGSIVYGGIQYSMAGSDPQKISSAKDRIRNALFALFVFIFSYSFLNYLVPGGIL